MTRIELPERCDLAEARRLLPELRAALPAGPVEIDASAVSRPGLAVMQLLAAARSGAPAVRIAASPALAEAAALAGLADLLFDGEAA